jgi:tetratricopeptide (TPR) repeat protein
MIIYRRTKAWRCLLFILPFWDLIWRTGILLAGDAASNPGFPEERATRGLYAILLIVIVPLLIALFFLVRFLYRHTVAKKLKTTLIEDYRKEADDYEKAGKFVSAASIYDSKLKDYRKAAALYEKGSDYEQAAMLYDHLGMTDKAKEMYKKAGDLEDAAEVAMLEGEFDEAADLYDRAGKKKDVAKVMQQAGKTIYAVKAYREAGEYKKAALLLQGEGMLKEAADMFQIYLYEKMPESSTVGDFYSYALLLEKTGQVEKAAGVFKEIEKVNPAFRDVKDRLASFLQSQEEDIPEGKVTLRSFIRSGKLEPRYGLKLWVQILRSLQRDYRTGLPYGLLSPDNIAVDARNNISFLKRFQTSSYASPETLKGNAPDERADIYSAGVILYEMLTGRLEGLGSVRITDVAEDVPEWLDEIAIKCLRKVKEDRYQFIQDIFSDLKTLSKGKRYTGQNGATGG